MWWHILVILAFWKTEVGGSKVQALLGQITDLLRTYPKIKK